MERPLLFLQSRDNLKEAHLCACCYAFVGGPDAALDYRLEGITQKDDAIVSCALDCGTVYCSGACRDRHAVVHQPLCTGHCTSESDPLVVFKSFAVEQCEMFLLVAEWWIAQHRVDDNTKHEYTDFSMEPWWDVAVLEYANEPGGFSKAYEVSSSLRALCEDASRHLNAALPDDLPRITSEDIARRIGACNQNAMGVRHRHPLCRAIFDDAFRERQHRKLIQCLVEAGFIGDDEDCGATTPVDDTEEWDYSPDEIASYLSQLFMDEDGSIRDVAEDRVRDTVGDDLDYLFPPLDGTAMFSTICKMNHSCDPNVVILYKGNGWNYPLVAYAVALKDIGVGEELTICYIEKNDGFEERQAALRNYGFKCRCSRCEEEEHSKQAPDKAHPEETDDEDADEVNVSSENEGDSGAPDGSQLLQERLSRLETASNNTLFGAIPRSIWEHVKDYVARTTIPVPSDDLSVSNLLSQCCTAIEQRDFVMCSIVGPNMVDILDDARCDGADIDPQLYHLACITACLGNAHVCNFLSANRYLEMATQEGLQVEDAGLEHLASYVQRAANDTQRGPYT